MFDTLLASSRSPRSRARFALTALLLHVAIAWGVISAATASRAAFQRSARDTIALDLVRLPLFEQRGTPRTPPPGGSPEMSAPPTVADVPLRIPSLESLRFTRPTLDVAALSAASSVRDSGRPAASEPSAAVLGVSEVDVMPELRGDFQPHYPESLRAAGVSGRVVLEYVIDSEGTVDTASVRVVLSTQPGFSVAAREALSTAHFSPARRAGRPVAVRVRQTIRFATK
jgi:protein TonB